MPFRQVFVVAIAFLAIVGAALFVLSWDGDSADDDATDQVTTPSVESTTSTTTTIAAVTTTIPTDCGTEVDPEQATSTSSTTTTLAAIDNEAPADDADDDADPVEIEAPLIPTLGTRSSLSTVGLDEVTFGLTVNQARAAAGTDLEACGPTGPCYRVTPADAPEGISFLVHEGTIERVDIVAGPITTTSGAGIGTTEERLDELFGDQLERIDLGGGATDLVFVPADENDAEFRVAFTVVDGEVETLRSGRLPFVLEPDPCA